jgi:hypothetical protein
MNIAFEMCMCWIAILKDGGTCSSGICYKQHFYVHMSFTATSFKELQVQKTGFTGACDSPPQKKKLSVTTRSPCVRNSEAEFTEIKQTSTLWWGMTTKLRIPLFLNVILNHGMCEVYSKKKVKFRHHSKCKTCVVFLCHNNKKKLFTEYHGVTIIRKIWGFICILWHSVWCFILHKFHFLIIY